MNRRRLISRAAADCLMAVSLGLALAACGEDDGGGKDRGNERLDLVIGSSVPLSGELEDLGPPARKAAALALTEIRTAIDDADRRDSVKLVSENNRTDRARTLATVERMIDDDGASCVVGPWTGADTIAVARDVTIPRDVPLITPAATLEEISTLDDHDLVSRTVPPDSAQGAALAKAIEEDLGEAKGRTVDVLARADAGGEAIAAAFALAWEEAGGEIGERVIYGPGADPSATAERTSGSEADALVVIEFPEPFAELAPELERAGHDPATTWGTDFLASTELADRVGDDSSIEGLRGTIPGTPDDDEPSSAFAKRFAAAEPEDVKRAPFDAQTFDAVVLCYLAAVSAGSTDGAEIAARLAEVSGPPGKDFTWEQLPEAIEALGKGERIDYRGASGPIDLDLEGDPAAGVYDVYGFADGTPRIVDEVPYSPARR
jgi:branched-chain amino acid transport system substrate-binding protein